MDFMTILSNILGELFAPTTAAYALAAIGLNIHFGMSGLMNMGQAGFMLLGAYGFAITQMNGCDLFTSVLTALVLAAIYGILLGIPTLKLGPDYLAMVTLAAAEIIRIVGRSTSLTWLTGGSAGIAPQNFTEKFENASPLPNGSTKFLLWTVQQQHRELLVAAHRGLGAGGDCAAAVLALVPLAVGPCAQGHS